MTTLTQTYYPGRDLVQEYMPDGPQHRREIARTVNLAMTGRINGAMSVTLTANVATTTVTDRRINIGSVPVFSPMTANAAAELPTMYFVPSAGSCVIHHANNTQTDRTFNAIFIG